MIFDGDKLTTFEATDGGDGKGNQVIPSFNTLAVEMQVVSGYWSEVTNPANQIIAVIMPSWMVTPASIQVSVNVM